MNIETSRLLIRKFKYEDWQDVYTYTSDATVMKYIPEGVFSKDDAKKFVNENMKENVKNFPVVLKNEKS
ncbi:Acetyltransferase, GNAT family, putative [Priestia megaterium WSH-002]|uniref:Acetyltransferase, GNAT family, putative n=1 Tax=Priestia megaterium (strain WSH-002) TaxID=1006007 RepID=A0A8D3X184_PRIMW|nr:Acetyltransferase, GNAT family, putative [Priestia megaterium WSH-002]